MLASPKTVEEIMKKAKESIATLPAPSLRERILSAKPTVKEVIANDHHLGPIFVCRITLEARLGIQHAFERSKDGSREDKQSAMAMIAATFLCDVHGEHPFKPDESNDIAAIIEHVPAHVADAIIEQGLEFNGMGKKKEADPGKASSAPTPNSA